VVPNSLHTTPYAVVNTGIAQDFRWSPDFKPATARFDVVNLFDQIYDHAIRSALREKKPAYIDIACNVASAACDAPGPISAILGEEPSAKKCVGRFATCFCSSVRIRIRIGSRAPMWGSMPRDLC
jgi:hypothetical protein